MALPFSKTYMKSNSLGKYYGFTAFGESHGHSVGLVIEDVLSGIDFPFCELRAAIQRRKPAQGYFTTTRKENDDFEVISGVFEGKTTGMPICLLFRNVDFRSEDYEALRNVFRPGHADFSWFQKFKIYDHRGGGRASGRETISRVAAGAFVKNILGSIQIRAYPLKIGNINAATIDFEFMSQNALKWADPETFDEVMCLLQSTKEQKDSLGSIVEVVITNVPAGLGDPVFEKLDANLAKAIISIGGVKGIEFGTGFALCGMNGSEANLDHHQSGIAGGVSDGKTISMKIAVKPVSSIGKPQLMTHFVTGDDPMMTSIKGRHDICLVPRILPVIESMIQLTLADAIAYQDLISSKDKDLNDYREAINKIDEDILIAFYRRFEIVKSIGEYKKKHDLPICDKNRESEVLNHISQIAEEFGISAEFAIKIWTLIMEESRDRQ